MEEGSKPQLGLRIQAIIAELAPIWGQRHHDTTNFAEDATLNLARLQLANQPEDVGEHDAMRKLRVTV